MQKKYIPFIALFVAAMLLFWVLKNQRGESDNVPINIEIPAAKTEPIDRSITSIVYSKHARCRMECRQIDESEVKEILQDGKINYAKIESGEKGMTYPIEGITNDRQHVRIVFAPHNNELVVVTAIDLEKEWPCDCN